MSQIHIPLRGRALLSRLLLAASAAAVLAGCNTTRPVVTGTIPDDFRERHPIAIQEGVQTVDLFIGAKRGGLTPSQRTEVMGFAGTWRREATGGIVIDLPSHSSNAGAAAAASVEVRSMLAAAGVPPQAVRIRHYVPADPTRLATLKLSYPRMKAAAGPCGLWPEDLGATANRRYNENLEYWNFGCASQRNLAVMVENPADLVQPRAEGPSYTGRRTTVLDKYHRGESTATTYPDTQAGKISGLGQ